jgi:DNA-binding SARP family transcriptional activator
MYLTTESALGATFHQRESLMTLLWPGLPLKSAQVNLRQTLYQLRQAIPASSQPESEEEIDFLLTDRRMVQVNPEYPLELDVAQFVQGLNGH